MRNVDLGYAGIANRVDQVVQSLVNVEETNQRQLSRLVDKGRRFEREAQRLDPEKYQERKAELVSSFNQVAQRADGPQIARRQLSSACAPKKRPGRSQSAALVTRLEQHEKTQRANAARLSRIADRLDRLENFDPKPRWRKSATA